MLFTPFRAWMGQTRSLEHQVSLSLNDADDFFYSFSNWTCGSQNCFDIYVASDIVPGQFIGDLERKRVKRRKLCLMKAMKWLYSRANLAPLYRSILAKIVPLLPLFPAVLVLFGLQQKYVWTPVTINTYGILFHWIFGWCMHNLRRWYSFSILIHTCNYNCKSNLSTERMHESWRLLMTSNIWSFQDKVLSC